MRIVFWENVVSQHKQPYWKALAASREVSKFVLIVEQLLYKNLQKQGWENELQETEKFELYVNPSKVKIKALLQENIQNSYHVFSGIRAIPMVLNVLKISKDYPIKRILLTESVNTHGVRAVTRRLASFLIERRYQGNYDIVLGSGANTEKWYLECGVKPRNFYPFLYATKSIDSVKIFPNHNVLKVVFVGRVERAKGLDILLKSLSSIENKKILLDVYGDLVEEVFFKNMVIDLDLKDQVTFKGVKSNTDLRYELHKYQVLCLPSRWDGWGAVINEALDSGLKVICSDRCGASILILNDKIGHVFDLKKPEILTDLLEQVFEQKDQIDREYILEYSTYLRGDFVAQYLISILNFHYKNIGNRPLPPWKRFQIEQEHFVNKD